LAELHLRELAMPISIKKSDQIYRRTYRRLVAGIFIVYGTVLLAALIGSPKVASWVSEAAQAELVGANALSVPEPMRRAEPATPIQTVKAD